MRTIKLTESQFKLMMESAAAPDFSDGDVQECPKGQVGTTTTVHDDEGNPKYGKPHDTDQLDDFLAIQNWWAGNLAQLGRLN